MRAHRRGLAEIVPALKLDARIGRHAYLAPGLGIAGGNLERDLADHDRLAADYGTEASLIRACLANSRHRNDWPLRVLHGELLAHKPDARLASSGSPIRRTRTR